MEKNETSVFEISYGDTLRFRRIVMEVMSLACVMEDSYDGIGTLGEKQMHAAIKRFVCPDVSKHEVKLDGEKPSNTDGGGKKTKARRFVADVLDGKNVYEIQTGSLAPLVAKIKWIFENTDLNVTIIHPIAETKWVNLIDEKGNITKRYKSPVKGRVEDIAGELYFLKELIACPRFSLVILVMEGEQYKKIVSRGKKGFARYKKYELIPVSLLRAHIFHGLDDYKCFVPDALEPRFTVKQFSQKTKIRGKDAYSAVHSLCDMGLLRADGNIGRAAAYSKTY